MVCGQFLVHLTISEEKCLLILLYIHFVIQMKWFQVVIYFQNVYYYFINKKGLLDIALYSFCFFSYILLQLNLH